MASYDSQKTTSSAMKRLFSQNLCGPQKWQNNSAELLVTTWSGGRCPWVTTGWFLRSLPTQKFCDFMILCQDCGFSWIATWNWDTRVSEGQRISSWPFHLRGSWAHRFSEPGWVCTLSRPETASRRGWRELTIVYLIPQCSSVKCYCFPEAQNIILP